MINVKHGVAVLLLVPSFALNHAIRRDKLNGTHQLVVDGAGDNLLGHKMYMPGTCMYTTSTALVTNPMAVFRITSQ
jgi:hypothetical protein